LLSATCIRRVAVAGGVRRLYAVALMGENDRLVARPLVRRRIARWAIGTAALAALGVVGMSRWHWRAPVTTEAPAFPRLLNTSQPADWTKRAKMVASVPGHVHCFSLAGANRVRLIWGNPRRAEDVDLDSGARRPAALVTEAYATGCPDLSPDGRELLFSVTTPAGGAEIRRSPNPEGRDATPVTPGWSPVWRGNGEEFVYAIDAAHAAVFSLPAMKFRLIADPAPGSMPTILGKAVSDRGGVALMFFGKDGQFGVTVYDGVALEQQTTLGIPGARNFRFAPGGERLFVSPRGVRSPLAALDWRTPSYRHIGFYSDAELADALVSGQHGAVLARRQASDVWLYEGSSRRRLTTDGNNDGAAISPRGDLLLAKAGADATEHIWSLAPNGTLRRLTNGSIDTSPDFSPDGSSWTYVDYAHRSVMVCTTGAEQCRVLRRDDMIPLAPRFSPDGSKIAYLRLGTDTASHLLALSVADGKEWPMGVADWQCPPVWSSATTVWALEAEAGGYGWVEKEVETGLRTGHRVPIAGERRAVDDQLECWPRDVAATSPFFRKLRVETEETGSVLRLAARELTD
jgi:hypothetical protein